MHSSAAGHSLRARVDLINETLVSKGKAFIAVNVKDIASAVKLDDANDFPFLDYETKPPGTLAC